MPVDVAIVGGGISGLTAARTLCARGFAVRLIEREPACGGVIHTDAVDGFVIDSGPDTLLAHKPAALALVRELGLEGSLVAPHPRRTTYVVRDAGLRTLPETSALGLPTGWRTVVDATAFSLRGKLRMAAEPFIRPAPPADDESIASFVRRRFGREAVKYVAEPLLAGLHRGDPSRLSMRALFPFLARAERDHGSVTRAWQRMPARSGGGSGSMSLREGLSQIPRRMQSDLPPDVPITATAVVGIQRSGKEHRVLLQDGRELRARALLLATPAYATASLVSSLDAELARLCATIRYVPASAVALGFKRSDIADRLDGWGFVVPARERRRAVKSASWVSSKWPGRAPGDHALLRLSLDANVTIDMPDEMLVEWALADLRPLLRITGAPVLSRVYRRPRAMPQLEVGHLDKIAAIDRRLAEHGGLFVSAAGFRGVGLPDCIADAQKTAEKVEAWVRMCAAA